MPVWLALFLILYVLAMCEPYSLAPHGALKVIQNSLDHIGLVLPGVARACLRINKKYAGGGYGRGYPPFHTLEKKSRYELNGGFSCIF